MRSPSGTTLSENLTVTWRICATSPCGVTLSTDTAEAVDAATRIAAPASNRITEWTPATG